MIDSKNVALLLKTYRMFQQMMRYPELLETIREIFRKALEKAGVDEEIIRSDAAGILLPEESDEKRLREAVGAVTDLYFARHFTPEEIENHINLARKQHRFEILNKVVNTEGATFTKMKQALKEFCEIPMGDLYISPNQAEGARVALINHFISNQLPFIGIAKNHITIRDINELVERTFSTRRRPGKIGGKSAGMFLAYKILAPTLESKDPDIERHVRIPESYYFNSGVFSDFIDSNRLYQFHTQKYKTREEVEEEYAHIAKLFRNASFPPDVVEGFRKFLKNFGDHPLILRSSSLLEDNFGYAFSGKYDSVFLANAGDPETRLNNFIWGLKKVHMSTFGPGPILYRRDHNLLDFDEKMSVLVQKVVGRRFGDYFFPFASGVAFSYSSYSWSPRIDKEAGLVRLVFGLGTRAVDRTGQDYPRMIYLSHPLLRPETGAVQISKYSQKQSDVLNLRTGEVESIPFPRLAARTSHPDLYHAVSINRDGHLSPPNFKGEPIPSDNICLTFENLIAKTPFTALMKKILARLEEAYGGPVDVEFAWEGGILYILQCRSLAVSREIKTVELPKDLSPERIVFRNNRVMSGGIIPDIEYVVYVDPWAYARLSSYEEKLSVVKVVSHLNRLFQEKRYVLFGPGRWGSNDINLGVKVAYEDINRALALGEIAFATQGYTPEVSYGTHFFNDLVESKIVPISIFPGDENTVFNEAFLLEAPNRLGSLIPELSAFSPVVHVIHVPAAADGRMLHIYQDSRAQQGIGFLGAPEHQI